MATITIQQARQYAANAGFTGLAMDIIVAIAQAESGLDPNAQHTNTDGTIDRGILQINSFWHAEVSNVEAYDPMQAFIAAFHISKQGTDFHEWTTFRTKAYLQTPAWKQFHNADGDPQPQPIQKGWTLDDSKRIWPWMFPMILDYKDPHVFHWQPPDENGTDFGLPLHTQITSLTLGKVLTTGYFGGGGVVCVQSTLPSPIGKAVVYYQHLDTISVKVGDTVHVGDEIGLSGGQLTGGVHPVTCCSTGPHIEVGINPPNNGDPLWVNLGANVDPWPFLTTLAQKGPSQRDLLGGINPGVAPVSAPTSNPVGDVVVGVDAAVSGTGPVADSFLNIEQRIDNAMALHPFRMEGHQAPNPLIQVIGAAIPGIGILENSPLNVASDAASLFSGVVDWIANNTYAVMLRALFISVGLLIFIAFVFAMFSGLVKVTGAEDVAKTAAAAGV